MTKRNRISNIIRGAASILFALLLILVHEAGLTLVLIIIGIGMTLKGIKSLIYYLSIAKHMVDGKLVLCQGLIYLDLGIFTSSIAGNPDAKTILLVSTLSEITIVPVKEAIASRLDGRTVDMKTGFLRNSEAIQAAAKADAVILTEEKGVSLKRDIERMAETLMISGSKVIGSIIL